MRCNIIIGGPAGAGPNFVSNLISKALIERGFFVFNSREYESRIRGGHNFNIVSFSDKPIYSNPSEINVLVALDELAFDSHKKELKKDSIVIKGNSNNVYDAAQLFKIFGIEFSILDGELKKAANYEENIKAAREGYQNESRKIAIPGVKRTKQYLMNGAEGVALGAIKSDLEFYYAYPMTPATTVLFELAAKQQGNKHRTVELESEIACVNAAAGSALTGAKTMTGTSGGGFDLMTEALSMLGIAEIPLVFYLAQRVGPGTGAATYQSQGDLQMALHSGHGEFSRIVSAPGDPVEAVEKTCEMFYLTQKYKIPGIILSDKHLAESFYTMTEQPKITKSGKTIKWPGRFTSYEATENKESTGNAEIIIKNVKSRLEKAKKLNAEIEKLETFKVYGKEKSSNLIVGWGSTKGAILDALSSGIDAKFLQIIYLEPFSEKLIKEIKKAKNIILVENNSTSQLSQLMAEKCLVNIPEKNRILKYNGRAFFTDELVSEIKKRMK